MLLLLTITQNCFMWRHCRIRTYQVLVMNIHLSFLMTPANTKQVNMKARESEAACGPCLHLCQLSCSLDTHHRTWVASTLQNTDTLVPKPACSHPLFSRHVEGCVCVCMHSQQMLCWLHWCSTAASAQAGPLLGMHYVVSPDSNCQSLAGINCLIY